MILSEEQYIGLIRPVLSSLSDDKTKVKAATEYMIELIYQDRQAMRDLYAEGSKTPVKPVDKK